MKQQLLTEKFQETITEETTVKSQLLKLMEQKQVAPEALDVVARHILIDVDGTLVRIVNQNGQLLEAINTVLKPSQEIKILPAKKAG